MIEIGAVALDAIGVGRMRVNFDDRGRCVSVLTFKASPQSQARQAAAIRTGL